MRMSRKLYNGVCLNKTFLLIIVIGLECKIYFHSINIHMHNSR